MAGEMKLFYETPDKRAQLYLGDARRLTAIEDKSVDLIVTSPPYNVGLDYNGLNDWLPREEYLELLQGAYNEIKRVLVIGGRLAINFGNFMGYAERNGPVRHHALPHHLQIGNQVGLTLRELGYWYKGDHLTGAAGDTAWGSWLSPSSPYLRQVGEPFLVWHKGEARHTGDGSDLSPNEFKSWTTNVWLISPRHHPKHPAVFPDEFAWRCIKLYSFIDDVVLDSFVGSGTTCAIAYKLGRRAIGIDLKEEYLEMAKKRLLQGVLL